MGTTRGLRWRAGLGLSLVTLLALTPALPASALDSPKQVLTIAVPNLTVAPGTDGQGVYLTLFANQAEELPLREVVLKIDGTGLAGAATVAPLSEFGCETEGPVTTCTEDELAVDPEGFGWRQLEIKPAEGATIGQRGTFTVTISAAGGLVATATSTVTVGDQVNLTNVRDVRAAARPGGDVKAPLAVRNSGTAPIAGVDLFTFYDVAITPGTKYRNCEYSHRYSVCHFDTTLAVGAEYSLAEPFPLHIGADAWAPKESSSEIFWVTPADSETWWGGSPPKFTPGTAAPLRLVQAGPAKRAALGQTDPNPEDNWGQVTLNVQGKNQANFVTIGDKLQGGAGSVVTARVGVRNDGPASVENRSGSAVRLVNIDLPKGTKSILVPKDCAPLVGDQPDWDQQGKPGAARYRCTSDWTFLKDEKLIWEFRLRIDNPDSAPGTVTSTYTTEGPVTPKPDLKPADDVAKILVNAATPGGGGGELPNTGARIAGAVGTGLALIVLGGVLLMTFRRRRLSPAANS